MAERVSADELLTVNEYVAKAKAELDAFAADWKSHDPTTHPHELSESDWGEQELAVRFGMTP